MNFKKINRALAGGLVTLAGFGTLLAAEAGAAHAAVPYPVYRYVGPTINVDQSPGSVPYEQARISGSNFTPNNPIWFGVKDTVTGTWYGGWTSSDSNGSFVATTTSVPPSSRCHQMVAHADIGQGYTTGAARDVTFTDICPNVAVNPNPSAQSSPIGFGQVELSGTGYTPGGWVWWGVQDTTNGTWYDSAWTTATSVGYFQIVTSKLPATSCGHQMRADAADWSTNFTNGLNTPKDQYFTLSCAPTLSVDNSGVVTGTHYTTNGGVEIFLTGLDGQSPSGPYYTASPDGTISYHLGFYPECETVQAKDLVTGRMSQVYTAACIP